MQGRRRGFAPPGGGFSSPGGGFARVGGGFAEGAAPPWRPRSGGEILARTGVAWDSFYLFNVASGNVPDLIGAAHLVPAITPVFGGELEGVPVVSYDSASDRHGADVHDLGSDSGIYLGECAIPAGGAASTGLFGRANSPFNEGLSAGMLVPATGLVGFIIRDDGAFADGVNVAGVDVRGAGLFLLGGQVDRAASVLRVRVALRSGLVAQAEKSIAGAGSLSGASQDYRHGATLVHGVGSGSSHSMAAVARGAQCEGADKLAAIFRGLGYA